MILNFDIIAHWLFIFYILYLPEKYSKNLNLKSSQKFVKFHIQNI